VSRYDRYRNTRVFGSLDGLRCFSILAVIWHHTTAAPRWLPMAHNGFLGVDLFFVISGFLIVTLLLRERDTDGGISLRRFYVRRSLRIFPVYYGLLAVLSVTFLVIAPGASMAEPFFAELPFYATYTSNWIETATLLGIAWSLASEEQFYLAWPPIERFLARGAVPLILVVIAINQAVNFGALDGLLAVRIGSRFEHLEILQSTFTPICFGVLLAHALHSRAGFQLLGRLFAWPGSSLLWLGLLLLLVNWPDDLRGWPRLCIHTAMAGLVAACVVREDHRLGPLLSFAPVRRIGVISYGMYLYHLFCRHAADTLLPGPPNHGSGSVALFGSTLVLTIFVADLSYRWYEAPFLRLKTRFGAARAGSAPQGPKQAQPRVPGAG